MAHMAFKEYGNYDAVGLADLVRKKQVTPRELLDEAIARTAKLDPQIKRSSSSITTMPSVRSIAVFRTVPSLVCRFS
jgi:Asp-tRNA(Asn)/Glu-tRNA(Gln) amidotransferase A subunit family amidase